MDFKRLNIITILLLLFTFLSCTGQKPEYEITCTETGCSGTYTGPEFDRSKPAGKKDIAHRFSNHMATSVGDELKTLYKQKIYVQVNLEKISMTTKDKNGIGNVVYTLEIPFVSVKKPCDCYTAFDHRGGWDHKILESTARNVFRNKKNLQLVEKNTPEGLQEFWVQYQHMDYQSGCK